MGNEVKMPENMGDAGKELIAKFRRENAELQKKLAAFDGINLGEINQLREANENYQTQLNNLTTQLETFSAKDVFNSVAKQKIDADYTDLAWANFAPQIQKDGDSFKVGDKDFGTAIADFVERYPAMAATSTGSAQGRGEQLPKEDHHVDTSSFMQNVDDIAAGRKIVG